MVLFKDRWAVPQLWTTRSEGERLFVVRMALWAPWKRFIPHVQFERGVNVSPLYIQVVVRIVRTTRKTYCAYWMQVATANCQS